MIRIDNVMPRLDTREIPLDAHDGCLHWFGDRYYLYGTAYGAMTAIKAVLFDGMRHFIFVLPPIVYYVTKRICLSLQRSDEELLHHGIESGTIRRLPSGEFIEETVPVPMAYQATIGVGGSAPAAIEGHGSDNGHPSPGAKKPRGFFRDKTIDRKEPLRPEATMPELEKSGKPPA